MNTINNSSTRMVVNVVPFVFEHYPAEAAVEGQQGEISERRVLAMHYIGFQGAAMSSSLIEIVTVFDDQTGATRWVAGGADHSITFENRKDVEFCWNMLQQLMAGDDAPVTYAALEETLMKWDKEAHYPWVMLLREVPEEYNWPNGRDYVLPFSFL